MIHVKWRQRAVTLSIAKCVLLPAGGQGVTLSRCADRTMLKGCPGLITTPLNLDDYRSHDTTVWFGKGGAAQPHLEN